MFLNDVIVEKLANNRAFQQFAVKTNQMSQQIRKEGGKIVEEQSSKAKEFAQDFRSEFVKNLQQNNRK
eukprot:CAMPEP_0113872274 /NCGR_PEP_ID=MMETSP0780_2-20120614/3113_1 /TAXON_ID=652834 /ORGANISM="Palpitomonas bilix" /LENGTH=67 /DNA_ID=CAMNT_0000857769 /DNA_START=69 /DNA_END=272 /DNA_ORIENTATION=- /assembly_acc=CAM_ASM_000599